jgi:hypothetical protein
MVRKGAQTRWFLTKKLLFLLILFLKMGINNLNLYHKRITEITMCGKNVLQLDIRLLTITGRVYHTVQQPPPKQKFNYVPITGTAHA